MQHIVKGFFRLYLIKKQYTQFIKVLSLFLNHMMLTEEQTVPPKGEKATPT